MAAAFSPRTALRTPSASGKAAGRDGSGQSSSWERSRWWSFIALLAVVATSLLGCEGGKESFLACKLDPILTDPGFANRPCTSDFEGRGSQETCVVDPHPQCATDICLAWSGGDAFCTETCSSNADCATGSVCLGYGVSDSDPEEPAARYCVKIEAVVCETSADCYGGVCNSAPSGVRRCAPPSD